MASPKVPKDKFFEKVINPYLAGVLQHPQSIEMREGVLHIRDVEGPKKTGSVEARLEAMEQQVFKCQGMVEHGLNANHMMITEFTSKHKIDANNIGKHLSKLYDRIDHLQAQIYDLQNQNWAWKLYTSIHEATPRGNKHEPATLMELAALCWRAGGGAVRGGVRAGKQSKAALEAKRPPSSRACKTNEREEPPRSRLRSPLPFLRPPHAGPPPPPPP
ncbi:40S ribosomal protein S5-1 [Hordeum vulgare]|nr:40S ribosomal protein S5-1 [Hordeum vulgare]